MHLLDYTKRHRRLEMRKHLQRVGAGAKESSDGPSKRGAEESGGERGPNAMLLALGDLFVAIDSQRKRMGVLKPRDVILTLKRENVLFRGNMHQDAHEFLNFLLNNIGEVLQAEQKAQQEKREAKQMAQALAESAGEIAKESDRDRDEDSDSVSDCVSDSVSDGVIHGVSHGVSERDSDKDSDSVSDGGRDSVGGWKRFPNTIGGTFVHDVFEGVLTNETRCLCCETITSRDEGFLDLSVDVEENSSLTHCLNNFSSVETLDGGNKFYCETCCSLQEAHRRMRVKKLPKTLVVHLKRFKYVERLQRHAKVAHRVAFPFEMKLQNTSDAADDPDRLYELFGIVAHLGVGPNQGHYISTIKSHQKWMLFDDERIEVVEPWRVKAFFGAIEGQRARSSNCGYLLLYQAVNEA
mmetsp:Transcript_18427/g.71180  ORF Transcript_18427/g.71180 Transcript_18427/m.71180 type:complete len:409 (+) Transcript_18427:171-1397(+)